MLLRSPAGRGNCFGASLIFSLSLEGEGAQRAGEGLPLLHPLPQIIQHINPRNQPHKPLVILDDGHAVLGEDG